ncbi:MAG: S8 family peptidase [Bacteroidota bacterium]|nr:S8 family peptidase [Bacteroidota bacterium]
MKNVCSILFIWVFFLSIIQKNYLVAQSSLPKDWYLLDYDQHKFHGISLDKVYEQVLKGRKSKTVIVAVLDSGVEADHEDLKENMWVNPKEIPGNGKDDDNNGYVDDIHGWNFIGGKDGRNVESDTYESTRLYAKLKYKYDNADPDKIASQQKKEYDMFLKVKKEVEGRRKAAESNLEQMGQSEKFIMEAIQLTAIALGDRPLTAENIDSIEDKEEQSLVMGKKILLNILEEVPNITTITEIQNLLQKEFIDGRDHFEKELNYSFNPDFDSRLIVGDRKDDVNERYYGNNDVEGPAASHGTHVAGLIGAVRNNGKGINGIADNVKIMSVRCVPDGDERDKDVANAIRYAVDNGAQIINMSFGKGYSPDKEAVDAAVKYAEKNDVLLIHAAGNGAANVDKVDNFPNNKFKKKKLFSSGTSKIWMEIGALAPKPAPDMIATFSNYGKKNVDVFSPGVAIYSTVPNNSYETMQGTSMASPIAAGVAAVIRSYFPTLTAKQVKEILRKSAVHTNERIKEPGTRKEVSMSDISNTGGMVNVYEAAKLASATKGKKKVKDWGDGMDIKQEKVIKP